MKRLFYTIAHIIIDGFDDYFAHFQHITLGAQQRFENADWKAAHQASTRRIELYKACVSTVSADVASKMGDQVFDTVVWSEAKEEYIKQITDHTNYEIAETFFNSVYCDLFKHKEINDEFIFVHSINPEKPSDASSIINAYPVNGKISELVIQVLEDYQFDTPWENLERDVRNIVEYSRQNILPGFPGNREKVRLEILKSVFFRSQAAYVVGRIVADDEHVPFVIPVLTNSNGEIFVDTLISSSNDVSIIFSFTRAYFMVDAPIPSEVVNFLKTLMPHKNHAELYNSIGFSKHGKTEFYRQFVNHLEHSDDEFIIAPGIKGMVMSVFTLPSYPVVFKLIKDRFDPPKSMTKQVVRDKYKLVSRHDKVGRMADTQEFANYRFPIARFSKELLDELYKVAPSIITTTDTEIIFKHLYTERKMVPLNLYLQDATDHEIELAMNDYGNAIKQLAAANIFPGDMLLKNFGVTRHGRVVFYDYDEIVPLTECNFRKIPQPQTEEQEMADRPWYPVEPEDVFPEEFRYFFTGNPKARNYFDKQHSDIYDMAFWTSLQDAINNGAVMDFFPYRRRQRFKREHSESSSR